MSEILVFAFLFFYRKLSRMVYGGGVQAVFSKSNPERKWINPGFLTGPYLPIYGFGLWGMYFVSMLSSVNMTGNEAADAVIILVTMAVVMTLIEYIAGLIFIKGMNLKLWDYTEMKGNIQGIICPQFSIIWGLLGCIYYFVINPYVIRVDSMAFSPSCIFIFIGMFLEYS